MGAHNSSNFIAVISDMHLAPADEPDHFGQHQDDRPARRLQHLENVLEEVKSHTLPVRSWKESGPAPGASTILSSVCWLQLRISAPRAVQIGSKKTVLIAFPPGLKFERMSQCACDSPSPQEWPALTFSPATTESNESSNQSRLLMRSPVMTPSLV